MIFYKIYGGCVHVSGKIKGWIIQTSLHLLACSSHRYLIPVAHNPIHVHACTAAYTFHSAHKLSVLDQYIHSFNSPEK